MSKRTDPDAKLTTSAAALAAFRADLPLKAPNARSLAATIETPGCTARRVLDSVGFDKVAHARFLEHLGTVRITP